MEDEEKPVLAGFLSIKAHSGFSTRMSKKLKYVQLFKASPNGIERLEISDNENDKNTRIITLENCVKITLELPPSNALHIITKTVHIQLHSSNDATVRNWRSALQSIAFKEKIPQGSIANRNVNIEEDNDLYCSSNSEGIFTVTLISTEASMKCGLVPVMYTLMLSTTEIQLKSYEQPSLVVAQWPYRFIRKYGYRDGKFTFEAGRKCDTGEGIFKLDNVNPKEIFRCMSSKMKSMKKMAMNGDSSNSTDNVHRLPIQLSAAISMEPGSRSPLPPTAQNSFIDPESNSFLGFMSSYSDMSSSSFSTNTAISLLEKSSPSKPPRKVIPPSFDLQKTSLEQKSHNAANISSVFIQSHNSSDLNSSTELMSFSNTSSAGPCKSDQDYERVEDITEAWKKLGIDDVNHTEKAIFLPDDMGEISVKNKCTSGTNYDTLDFFRTNQKVGAEYKTIVPINLLVRTPPQSTYASDDYEVVGEPSKPPATFRGNESRDISDDLDGNANHVPKTAPDTMGYRKADDSYLGYGIIRKSNVYLKNTPAIGSHKPLNTIDRNKENEKVPRVEYASVSKPKQI